MKTSGRYEKRQLPERNILRVFIGIASAEAFLGIIYLFLRICGLYAPAKWEYLFSGVQLAMTIALLSIGNYIYLVLKARSTDDILKAIAHYQSMVARQDGLSEIQDRIDRASFSGKEYPQYLETWRSFNRERHDYATFRPDNMPPIGSLEYLTAADRNDFYEFERTPHEPRYLVNFYWMKCLMVETRKKSYRYYELGLTDISFGFFNVDGRSNWDIESAYFGVILHLDQTHPFFDFYYRQLRPDYAGYVLDEQVIDTVQAGGFTFPVFVRAVHRLSHCSNPQPIGGTKTCIAESTILGQDIGLGFVTAKHVTGTMVGSEVPLACGHAGYIAHVGKEGIDAAFVVCRTCRQQINHPMGTIVNVAPWTQVILHTQNGHTNTMITDTTDRLGLYNYHQIPVHHFLADAGVPGDSGALITDRVTNEAIGIYLGAYVDRADRSGGYAIHAHQVAQVMNLQFYQ